MQLRRSVLFALMIILFIYFEIHSCSETSVVAPDPVYNPDNTICYVNDIFFLDDSNGWLVGQLGTIGITVDGGASWSGVKVDELDIRGVNFIDPDTGWIVGRGGRIFKTVDGGFTWENLAFSGYPREDDFYQVDFRSEDLGFVLGYHGVFITEDGGSAWINNWLPVVPFKGAWDMDMLDGNSGFLLGSSWTEPDPLMLYRTVDCGMNWTEVPGSNASVLKSILTVEFIDMNTGWAGGGKLLKTSDGGSSWVTQIEEATVREICFTGEEKGFAVGGSTILRTENGGDEWVDITPQDERIVDLRGVCFLNDLKGWVVGRGAEVRENERVFSYSIILSTIDGGDSWYIKELLYETTGLAGTLPLEDESPIPGR